MSEVEALLLSDHLAEALAALGRVREIVHKGPLDRHREAVVHEVTQAELSIARVIGLVAGAPEA